MAKKAKAGKKTKTRFDARRVGGKTAKAAKKSRGGKRQTKAEAEKLLQSGPVRKGKRLPRQQELVDDLRIRPLDNICREIKATRADIANLQQEEASLEQAAHSLMRKHGKMTWQHGGVTLVRVHGEEKLQVKTSRSSQTTAENRGGAEEPAEPATPAAGTEDEPPAEDLNPMDLGGGVEGTGGDPGGDDRIDEDVVRH